MPFNSLDEILNNFHKNISSLNHSIPLVSLVLNKLSLEVNKRKLAILESKVSENSDQDDSISFEYSESKEFRKLEKSSDLAETSSELVPRNFLVSFVSEFDAFIAYLIKFIYTKKPKLLSGLERSVSFDELLSFESIEDAQQHILTKEVESILRKSHSEHFSAMEKKFDVKLRKDLDIWPLFIELTERRNLFVHCDGIVSKQYMKVCSENNVDLSGIVLQGKLRADINYLKTAYKTLYELSSKLVHVLWRKLFPEERKEADSALNELAYDLISDGEYELAVALLDFGLHVIKKHDNERIKRMMVINLAQAYKKTGDEKKCFSLLKKYDWGAVGYEFKLAYELLNENYSKVESLLRKLVSVGDLGEVEVLDWPLFSDYRETRKFRGVFKSLFDKEYSVPDSSSEQEEESAALRVANSFTPRNEE